MLNWLYFLIALFLTILVHEFGHLISALLCGVKVEKFSIGFGKPILHKKLKGIDFAIAPILIGGYTKLSGEFDKRPNGLLAQRYSKKVFIILAGVFSNLIVALICYLLNYKSISLGITIDWALLVAIFSKNLQIVESILRIFPSNMFLLQLGLLNFGCFLFNSLPFPALDGSLLWLVLLEKKVKHLGLFIKKVCGIGFVVLMILQLIIIYCVYFI